MLCVSIPIKLTGAVTMKNMKEPMIESTNTELVLPEGVKLALIDANGKILEQGDSVKKLAFEAVKSEAVRCIMGRGRRLTKHDS